VQVKSALIPLSRKHDQSGLEQIPWHNPKTMRTAFILAVLLSFITSCSKPQVAPSLTPKFNDLSDSDTARLDQQRALVAAVAKRKYGTVGLTKTVADLPVLQRLIDDDALIKRRHTNYRASESPSEMSWQVSFR
jgi:hypothetical protein